MKNFCKSIKNWQSYSKNKSGVRFFEPPCIWSTFGRILYFTDLIPIRHVTDRGGIWQAIMCLWCTLARQILPAASAERKKNKFHRIFKLKILYRRDLAAQSNGWMRTYAQLQIFDSPSGILIILLITLPLSCSLFSPPLTSPQQKSHSRLGRKLSFLDTRQHVKYENRKFSCRRSSAMTLFF